MQYIGDHAVEGHGARIDDAAAGMRCQQLDSVAQEVASVGRDVQ
ncbi:hypothetical protein [Nocardia sp. CA-119907]